MFKFTHLRCLGTSCPSIFAFPCRYQTVTCGATKTSVVDPEILCALDARCTAANFVIVRGLLFFNAVLRSILMASDNGAFPLECAKDLGPLVRACVAYSNPYSSGTRTEFTSVTARAFGDCAALLDAEFPVSPARAAELREHLQCASGMLHQAAESVVDVHMAVMTGDPLRQLVRRHLKDRCALDDNEVLDSVLDAAEVGAEEMAMLSSAQHVSVTTGLLASTIVDLYHQCRDPGALARRRGVSASTQHDNADGRDADAPSRICRALTLKWLILQHETSRLPALAPVPACTRRALTITRDCVPPILRVAYSQLWARAHAATTSSTAAVALRERSLALKALFDTRCLRQDALLSSLDSVVGPLLARRGHLGLSTLSFDGASFHMTVPRVVMYTIAKPRLGVYCREVNFGPRGHCLRECPGAQWGSGRSRSPADFVSQRNGEFGIEAVPLHWDPEREGAHWIAADPGTCVPVYMCVCACDVGKGQPVCCHTTW